MFGIVFAFVLWNVHLEAVRLAYRAEELAGGHFLDDFLNVGRKFWKQIVADAVFKPVDAVAVCIDACSRFLPFPGNGECDGFPAECSPGLLAEGGEIPFFKGSVNNVERFPWLFALPLAEDVCYFPRAGISLLEALARTVDASSTSWAPARSGASSRMAKRIWGSISFTGRKYNCLCLKMAEKQYICECYES